MSGFEGTYPTLVGARLVVKLFGYFPGWREPVGTEVAANGLIENAEVSAPKILASGSLFPGAEAGWPFLIMERLGGQAWRDAELETAVAASVAAQLGAQIRAVHDLQPVHVPDGQADWIAIHGGEAAQRHRRWGTLPDYLIDQIPEYLDSYRAERRCLVHGDLTEDHLFVHGDSLLGIIDWGDAMVTDPFYELTALYLGAFAGDRRLLGDFLAGYGWQVDADFAEHALQVTLMHRFDCFGSVNHLAKDARSLADLAREVWTPIA